MNRADSYPGRAINAISQLPANAQPAEIEAAVRRAMLPPEPDYIGAVVRVGLPESLMIFVKVDTSEAPWHLNTSGGWHSWSGVCDYPGEVAHLQ